MSENLRAREDARDRARVEIDAELRRYRRRLMKAAEEFIKANSPASGDFDGRRLGVEAVIETAPGVIGYVPPALALEAGDA